MSGLLKYPSRVFFVVLYTGNTRLREPYAKGCYLGSCLRLGVCVGTVPTQWFREVFFFFFDAIQQDIIHDNSFITSS